VESGAYLPIRLSSGKHPYHGANDDGCGQVLCGGGEGEWGGSL